MADAKKGYTITFQPSQVQVRAAAGALLVDAAAQGGILIDIPCGGQGRCGRCLVRVERGEVSHRENPHLTPKQLAEGWVLSCTARVAGDLAIVIPPAREREKVVVETAATRAAFSMRSDWPRYPAVRQLFVELSPPSLQDTATDLERLSRALEREYGVDNLLVGLPVMRRLSETLRQGDWKVTAVVTTADTFSRLIDLKPGQARGPLWGVALDIGTTNVVLHLVDLRTGRIVEGVSALNKQVACGEDIISRIVYSQRGNGLEHLQRLVLETINELLQEICRKHRLEGTEVMDMVVAGNTTMVHLFLGLPPRSIREEPYVPTLTRFPLVPAGEVGVNINPHALIYCLPAVAAYVGGDITAGVLSSGFYKSPRLSLFLDVGTNGEMVLGNADWMTTCACSAGPAFEGAGVRWGMRAGRGAIEEVTISSRTLEPTLKVVGDVRPVGICGSGMISALAEMFITGVVDKAGRIDVDYVKRRGVGGGWRVRRGEHGAEYVLCWAEDSGVGEDIVLTEVDINNLIRTKGAIYAGISVMARAVGVPLESIEEVLIGGAFGRHINVERAIQIGLLPDLPWDRYKYLGNTSAWGAYNALLSCHARAKAEEIAAKMTYLELIAESSFMSEFTSAMFLPHTDIDSFPSVKAVLGNNRGG